jgi:hypothetical protein
MTLLPIFNKNAEYPISADLSSLIVSQPIQADQPFRSASAVSAWRPRERVRCTSIDLLRNLYDEIMTPLNMKADPRISKFRSSFYIRSENPKQVGLT